MNNLEILKTGIENFGLEATEEKLQNLKKYREIFFDIEKVDEFKDTAYNKDYREKKYKEGIENEYF